MTPLDLCPGQMITANVRLVHLLGEGGMGSVWVADHLSLQTQVAVKFMSTVLARDESAVARFRREAAAAARIKSPHVVQIFDHGVTPEMTPYMVMELLEGEDLGQHIQRVGPLPTDNVARVLAQACKALTKAHAAGIIHRDLKPDNLFLLDPDGELFVKVLDFGIAKQTGSDALGMTATGSMVGTPYYMSPEQVLSAKHVDFRADLWSLAVVAYHCLIGSVPFQGETLGALCVAIDKGLFIAPSLQREDIPASLDDWFAKALRREPAERFGSAREFSDGFSAALRQTSAPSLTPTSTPEPSTRSVASAPSAPQITVHPDVPLPPAAPSMASALSTSALLASVLPAATPAALLPIASSSLATSELSVSASQPQRIPVQPTLSGASLSQTEHPSSIRRTWLLGAIVGAAVATAGAGVTALVLARRAPATKPMVAETVGTLPSAAAIESARVVGAPVIPAVSAPAIETEPTSTARHSAAGPAVIRRSKNGKPLVDLKGAGGGSSIPGAGSATSTPTPPAVAHSSAPSATPAPVGAPPVESP